MSFKKFINIFKMYLWMIPAIILLFFFLVKPSIETVILSFQQKVEFSEDKLRQLLLSELSKSSGKQADEDENLKNIHGWENSIAVVEQNYHVRISKDEISDEMTIRDYKEFVIVSINTGLEKSGGMKIFAGFKNYTDLFKDKLMITAFKNNILWLFLFTFFTVFLGLIFATFIDKVKWAPVAKSIIFIPMAISFVASGIIWSFMYDKDIAVGTINAFLSFFSKIFLSNNNYESIAFLGRVETVNFALIAAGVWMWVGFCMVIFTAALKSMPFEIIEASKIDGASNISIFFRIEIPMILPTITVVVTTMIINVLKVFDIVYTMTGGGPYGSSEVIANRMYRTAFNDGNFEYSAAMAVILLIAIIPVMVGNIKSFVLEESNR